jgi:hypothetical protein
MRGAVARMTSGLSKKRLGCQSISMATWVQRFQVGVALLEPDRKRGGVWPLNTTSNGTAGQR